MNGILDDAVKRIAADFAEIAKSAIDAFRASSEYQPGVAKDLIEEAGKYVEEIIQKSDMLKGESVNLKTYDYWDDWATAKIETIGAAGGLDLMRRVHAALEDHHDNEEYSYSDYFDSQANGICGWLK